jgi:uncharacterized membrane protein
MENKNLKVSALKQQLSLLINSENCYYQFKDLCNKIIYIIEECANYENDTHKKQIYVNTATAISHTIDKEVGFLKEAEDLKNKKNAAIVSKRKFKTAFENSYNQILLDLILI